MLRNLKIPPAFNISRLSASTNRSISTSYGNPERYDINSCQITVTAGVGGAESFDWCKILTKMYRRFTSHYKHPGTGKYGQLPTSLTFEEVDSSAGDSGGFRMFKFNIIGDYAYKLLKCEKGAHRLVRNSPFNSARKRQTTFAGVQVVPILSSTDEDVQFYNRNRILQDRDLIIESMRSDGKGGQNVNKVETAVRITHKPTGLSVKIQQERTNAQNREIAIQKISEKVEAHYKALLQEKMDELQGEDVEAAWGKHMRSYILNPEQRFKDHRINYETQNVHDILDGNLLPVILTYLESEL